MPVSSLALSSLASSSGGKGGGSGALSGIQTLGGAIQAIGGRIQERRAEKALEALQTPTYTPSSSILDYYNKALQRYNVNPYGSPLYQMSKQNALRSTAMGLSALQNRRQALGGVQNLVTAQNDALLKAAATAEAQQGQQLSQLGQAANAKTGEMDKAFQYNQLAPYQKKYNLLAMKAGGGAGIFNAGLQNIFGGIGSASNAAMANQVYGSNTTGLPTITASNVGGGYSYDSRI